MSPKGNKSEAATERERPSGVVNYTIMCNTMAKKYVNHIITD